MSAYRVTFPDGSFLGGYGNAPGQYAPGLLRVGERFAFSWADRGVAVRLAAEYGGIVERAR